MSILSQYLRIKILTNVIVRFDEDLAANSRLTPPIETLVKVGYSLGKTPA